MIEIKSFKQIPEWHSNQKFEITSEELFSITKLSEAYSSFMPIFDKMISRFIDSKEISVRYEDMEGNNMAKEEVEEIMKAVLQRTRIDDNENINIEPNI